ncbi:MAG: hypothetical protein WA830_03385 [Candidatus Sulfotelmatobacter sp.]
MEETYSLRRTGIRNWAKQTGEPLAIALSYVKQSALLSSQHNI